MRALSRARRSHRRPGRHQARRKACWLSDSLVPVDPKDGFSVRFEQALPFRVVGPGKRIPMPPRAVGLEHQPLLWPSEVGNDRSAVQSESLVHVGHLEPVGLEDRQHNVLEFGPGREGSGKDLAKNARPPDRPDAVEHFDERSHTSQPRSQCFANDDSKLARPEHGGQGYHCPGRLCDEDAVVRHAVVSANKRGPVHLDPGVAMVDAVQGSHLDVPAAPPQHSPVCRRCPMT
jgi:hypothetical protein